MARDLEALLPSGTFTWKEELKRPAATGFWSWTGRKAEMSGQPRQALPDRAEQPTARSRSESDPSGWASKLDRKKSGDASEGMK